MEPELMEEEEQMDIHSHPDYEEVMRSLSRRMAKTERNLRKGYREQGEWNVKGPANDPLPPVEDTLSVEPKAAESEEDARTKNATVGERLRRLERALRKREQNEDKEEEKPKSERLKRKLERVKKRREQAEDEEKKLEQMEDELEEQLEDELEEQMDDELEEQLEDDELKEELEKPVVAPEVAAEKEPETLKERLSRRKSRIGNVRVKENMNSAIKKFFKGGR